MSEIQHGRRHQVQDDLGLTTEVEQKEINRVLEKEERRNVQKQEKMWKIEDSSSYQMVCGIAKWMDRYYLDPIIGVFVPSFGDMITSFFVVPFIYVSAVKVRSLPLTLAVIYNVMVDVLVGLIPFYIGDFCDIFKKAYVKNARLITGFVEDDEEIIKEVNGKAVWMGVMIALLCFLIYLMVQLIIKIAEWSGSAWDWMMGLF